MRTCQALEARMRINTWHSAMAAQTFQQEYMQMPPITRAYTTACVLTTIAVVSIFYMGFTRFPNPLVFLSYRTAIY